MKLDQLKQVIKQEMKREPEKQEKTVRNTAKQLLLLFFIAMFGFSFLSRAADSVMTAKISVERAQSAKLNFKINGSGILKEKDTTIVKLRQGLMIEQVYAAEGAAVQEGDALFSYNMEDLQKQYEEKYAVLEKNRLEQKKLSLNDTETALKSAQLDKKYAEQGLQSAKEDLDSAKNAIDKQAEEAYNAASDTYEKAKEDKESAVAEAKKEVEDKKAELKELEKKKAAAQTDSTAETVTEEEFAQAKKAAEDAKENLSKVKSEWSETVENAKLALADAKETWDTITDGSYDYTAGLSDANSALSAAEKALEQADVSIESAQTNQSNAKQTAELSSDSLQLDIDLAEKETEELKALLDNKGIVTAPSAGTVVSMDVKAGSTVSGSEVVSLAINGVMLEFSVEKEEAKKLSVGDTIQVQAGDSKEKVEASVASIGTEETEGMITCTVQMPEGSYRIGNGASFEWGKESVQYDYCIPIAALREDGYSQTYVLVTKSKESILGDELVTFRIDVNVLEKDKSTAAVEGGLSYEEQVIAGSNKEIAVGDRVRIDESE
ncbi:HlyD family efflux transporter periplasmic adaptor subunit [Konateibacter massiliensis]|uniref:HlyD family efflux transporter periplasmic adaptor subunit n=1 Tax=Konateibacter massiliensis TaxID=2002841 RepID=UPI000C1487C7|nr:HlyD family efflux transporter periplasmic adaptor subunit [Konateibacter massiliensis]